MQVKELAVVKCDDLITWSIMQDKEKITEKIMKYCAWRDRCTQEVLRKLTEMGASEKLTQNLIQQLKEEKFLNDHRFAISYARGKLANNQWGRIKIRYALSAFQIDKEFIEEALSGLDNDLYDETLERLVQKKLRTLKTGNYHEKYQKVFTYLSSKGFESDRIREAVNKQL